MVLIEIIIMEVIREPWTSPRPNDLPTAACKILPHQQNELGICALCQTLPFACGDVIHLCCGRAKGVVSSDYPFLKNETFLSLPRRSA